MARYISEEEFIAWVREHWCSDCQNDNGLRCRACWIDDAIDIVEEAPTADVAPRAEVFEGVDKFRSDLMGKFIDLCRGNDYNKLTLLKIDAVVCEIYDKQIAELKKKYTDATDTNDGHK